MAKRKKPEMSVDELPGVDMPKPEYVATPPPAEEKPEPEAVDAVFRELSLSVPYLDGVQGYNRRRVDVTLTSPQAEKLKGILQGLENKNATLANGRYVSTSMHAIQWMVENAG